jgi:hypothetical protein
VHEQLEWRGCLATVAAARDPGVVGVTGIVTGVSRNTVSLVTPRDRRIGAWIACAGLAWLLALPPPPVYVAFNNGGHATRVSARGLPAKALLGACLPLRIYICLTITKTALPLVQSLPGGTPSSRLRPTGCASRLRSTDLTHLAVATRKAMAPYLLKSIPRSQDSRLLQRWSIRWLLRIRAEVLMLLDCLCCVAKGLLLTW